MLGTIESTNGKIAEKITQTRRALDSLHIIITEMRESLSLKSAKKIAEHQRSLDALHVNLAIDTLETLENGYNLSIVAILSDYYSAPDREEEKTEEYYRIITGENFISRINDVIAHAKSITDGFTKILQNNIIPRSEARKLEDRCDDIMRNLDNIHNIEITTILQKNNYEMCKCGAKMMVMPTLSELHCPSCLKIKTIIGTVFRDDQFYPQEGQRTKHGGYDTARHYRVWIDRLQARENKTFPEKTLQQIEYVLNRDSYDRKSLTCEAMREILKDSKVSATSLNEHAPLLVKMFGGPAPPILSFQDHRILSIRFSKAMMLYEIVKPNGRNKPYYPYFIYKLIEHAFANDPEKLRLLDSIHLQSRETVIKNDKTYRKICLLADVNDGLVYKATDPKPAGYC
jgi:hypothetical protein